MSDFDVHYWQELDALIPGWMSQREAEFLIQNVQGTTYLEIGVAYGKSLRLVQHHFLDMNIGGIDKINHGVHDKVEGVVVKYGDAKDLLSEFEDNVLDTLFIDGDHRYQGCLADFVHYYNKVKSGGRIIFHDYQRDKNHIGVTQAVDAIKPLLKDFKQINFICAGTK